MNKLQINVRKNGRGNHGWTIQTQVTYWAQDTEQRQTKQKTQHKNKVSGLLELSDKHIIMSILTVILFQDFH
jgi:hypothetical protein